jgi:LPXTG-motif cell wall-anchored protein
LQVWMTVVAWDPQFPLTGWQMMVAGGALLFVAGLLIGWRRKNRVALQRSLLTDELMIYLSRIADAVERHADRPTAQQIAEMIERRIAEQQRNSEASAAAAGAGAAPKTRAVPFSMFGREYPEKS